tara:strand:+ start:325 stop:498 length:174 start_codon:yes stop_codon:yes gene_type:complete
MKESLMKLLKEYADGKANLSSESLREKLSEEIMTILTDERDIENKNQLNLFNEIPNS